MSDGQLAEGTIFADDYRVLRTIHAGGLSTLYEVEQISTGTRRALKVIVPSLAKDEKLRALFLEEARRVGHIQSDHVAEIVACKVDSATDLPYAALELVSGETLASLMARRGALPPREALDVLEQVSHALAAAHDVGVTHRDLKPEAILLAQSRTKDASVRCVVLFLGVGKLASEAKHNTTAAMSRPLWMAPEQTETDAVPSPATDVWVLGLLAYYLLTGRHYWKTARDMGSAMMSLMREVLFEDVATAGERAREQGVAEKLPYGFDPWFARCVARDPAQRFQHAREAMKELEPPLRSFASFGEQQAAELARASAPAFAQPVAPFGVGPTVPGAPAGFGSVPPTPYFASAPPPRPASGHPPPGGSTPPPAQLPPVNPPPRRSGGPPPLAPRPSGSTVPVGIIAAAIAGLVVLVALGIGAGVLYVRKTTADRLAQAARDEDDTKSERRKKDAPWSDEACPIPVSSKDAVWGDRAAPVTIVEFSDFQCPFCKKAEATIGDLRSQYGGSKLRVVWKNDPLAFHANARPAALAGEAVLQLEGSEAFWRFHKSAFDDQANLSPDTLTEWATHAGADRRSFLTRKEDEAVAKKVNEDVGLASTLGFKGTPTFFVNGRIISGAQAKEKFVEAVDLALAEAKVETDKGTPADKVYVTLTQRNFKKVTAASTDPIDDHTLYKVDLGQAPARGLNTALVTIVEFADFQCPYCAKSEPTLTALLAKYGPRLRVVWKDSPLANHQRALPAANFAREVRAKKGDEGFWRAHDILFENQLHLEDADLTAYGSQLGLDGVAVLGATQSEKHKKEIQEDQEQANALGVSGTPAFFINGRKLSGAQPIEKFEIVIDEEMAKAQALVVKGIPADAVYEETIKDGKGGTELQIKDGGPIPVGAPSRGALKPLVVIQEFSDFQCPFCKRVDGTLDDVLKDYNGKVQLVWRHFPLESHKDAHLAAEAAEEIKAQKGNVAFFKFKDKAFAAQPSGLDRAGLESMASELGVDMAKFRRALDDHTHAARVDADSETAKHLGFTGTPTFLVGKYLVVGAQPVAAFHRAIDKALADPKK